MKERMSDQANHERLNYINEFLAENIEEVFDHFDLKTKKVGEHYSLNCPCHANADSFSCCVYPTGQTRNGLWTCPTRGCEKTYQPTLIGFFRGILSLRENEGRIFSFPKTLGRICEVFNLKFDQSHINSVELGKRRFINMVGEVRPKTAKGRFLREKIRNDLDIPSQYFLNRGVPREILFNYDVGEVHENGKFFNRRAVVPIYNSEGTETVGLTGRSIYEKCGICEEYHSPEGICIQSPKWRNFGDFKTDYLYNFWNARRHIRESKVAVLVEGPVDVWGLEHAGIKNSVGLFGNSLSDPQVTSLEKLGVMGLITILDNDKAGQKGRDNIIHKYGRWFNIVTISVPGKDVAELRPEEIRRDILPKIKELEGKFL